MSVEDTGEPIDPSDGLRIAIEANEAQANRLHKPSTAFLRAQLQARCEAFIERWGTEDEEPEE